MRVYALTAVVEWACPNGLITKKDFPDAESAFYYSGVTYATIGYGDLLLKEPWRILAPFEGLTGILMCGLSASLFYVLGTRIYLFRLEAKTK